MSKIIITIGIGIGLMGCKPENLPKPVLQDVNLGLKQKIVETYAIMGFTMYSDAVTKAKDLKNAIDAFVQTPSQSGLENCKIAWQNARVPYAHTEPFRFYGGPIDAANTGRETFINAWPLDESYMDYVSLNSVSGIINDAIAYPSITASALSDLNQLNGETNLCTGYHAIEFMLWGQDLDLTGPGARPFTDFVDGGTAQNQGRRRSFLVAVSQLLIDDLQSVADQWDKSKPNNYRASFTNPTQLKVSLANILIGLGKYNKGEMSGQRIYTAYFNNSEEDEHDCFSDYTMTDIRNWQSGLKGIYYGTYTQINGSMLKGYSLSDFLKKESPETDVKISSKFAATDAVLATITTTFDQAIKPANPDFLKISDLIKNLRQQADSYADMPLKLDVLNEFNGLNTEE
ncbi:MAG: hypothetical protein EAZ27_03040 [Cytophagales bacterium]|nr:MAG: hypothetical protein EAZ27_03040 [Cytophagales bacterium]